MRLRQPKYTTIVHAAASHARETPDKIAFEHIIDPMRKKSITFLELHQQALSIAKFLRLTAQKGDRILLPTNNDLSFQSAFLACLYAGCVAVPIQIPRHKRNHPDMGLARHISVIRDADIKITLLDAAYVETLKKYQGSIDDVFPGTRVKPIQDILACVEEHSDLDTLPEPSKLAFLQYTSGSTSDPKGVMLTHECIVENQNSMKNCYQLSEENTFVSWLPVYHDMGLCTGLFMPLYLGVKAVMMTPQTFIAKPSLWIREISQHKNVVSGGPNFAYLHCTHRVSEQELQAIDLRQWTIAFCGAEPIRPETITQFIDKFSIAGFHKSAFFPSYGLAEATLFVSAKTAHEDPIVRSFCTNSIRSNIAKLQISDIKNITNLMSCGRPGNDIQVAIVNPETLAPLRDGEIGEIAVHSKSSGIGYWNNNKETNRTFHRVLNGAGKDKYLLTGDLGFILDRELYISGRRKEIIIQNGVNHYPQDIEYTAQMIDPELGKYKAAAFPIRDNCNSLILVLEVRSSNLLKNSDDLIRRIMQSVRLEHQLIIDSVIFVSPGAIPRTSSGKVQRKLCETLYQQGHFQQLLATKLLSQANQ